MDEDKKHRKRVAAATAVGRALGYKYTGNDLYAEIGNPRVEQWFVIADEAIKAYKATK